jgi:hypothetical protein
MLPVYLVAAALLALLLMIVIEVLRLYADKRTMTRVRRRRPRRQLVLEERIRSAFDEPRAAYGEIFVSYTIWRRDSETRLELFSGDPWLRLNEFTRSLVVRHLWRALEAFAQGAVVVVDAPLQSWSKEINAKFDDKGEDPWGPRPPRPPRFGPEPPLFLPEN